MARKVILVTGSNAGIGYDLVGLLAQKGHTVYLSARREAAGKEAQAKLKSQGLYAKFVQLDVTDISSVEAARNVIEQAEGRLDVLVHNAGIALFDKPQAASTVSLDVVRAAIETNFYGVIRATQVFLPLLRKSPQAGIVQVSTDMASNAYQARPDAGLHFVAYNTSKAAANSYMIALAQELQKDNIKVNMVTPGFTSTALNNFSEGGKSPQDGAKAILPWVLLDGNGPTCKFFGENGEPFAW